jgi:hypothetical protein
MNSFISLGAENELSHTLRNFETEDQIYLSSHVLSENQRVKLVRLSNVRFEVQTAVVMGYNVSSVLYLRV